jgi:hypothetical protein
MVTAFCPNCGKGYYGSPSVCPNCGKSLISSQPQSAASTQMVIPQISKSHTGRNIAITVILLVIFFVVPIVPYTFVNYSYAGGYAHAMGDVSLSFAIFHCGEVVNVQASGLYFGYSSSYSLGSPGWVCNGSG